MCKQTAVILPNIKFYDNSFKFLSHYMQPDGLTDTVKLMGACFSTFHSEHDKKTVKKKRQIKFERTNSCNSTFNYIFHKFSSQEDLFNYYQEYKIMVTFTLVWKHNNAGVFTDFHLITSKTIISTKKLFNMKFVSLFSTTFIQNTR